MTRLRENQKAYAYIDELLMNKTFISIKENDLLITLLTKYAVSEEAVNKFINRYTVMGIISINEGLIIKNGCE